MGSSFWTILVTQCNHKGPHKSEVRGSEFEREDVRMEGEVQVEEDALWVALKAEEGATSQGQALEAAKGKEMDSLLQLPEGTNPANTLILAQ